MKKVILSDIGNVVVNFDNHKTCQAIAGYSKYEESDIHRVLFCGPDRLTRDYTRGHIDTDEFRELVLRRFRCFGQMPPQEFDRAFAGVLTLNGPIVRLWRRLQESGIRIAAVSDVEDLRYQELERLGVMSLFEQAVLSFREGIAKPDEHMFVVALVRLGIKPTDAVFVDDLIDNIEAAESLGIMSHLYQDFAGLVEFLRQQGFPVDNSN